MSTKSTNTPEGLRTMLTQALHAYGLAHATQLQSERQAKAEQQKRLQLLQTQQQAQIQQVQISYERDESIADAKLERMRQLMTAIEDVKKASGELLEKAGLAHVAGAPLRLNDSAASVRDMNETVVSLFAAAQLAYVDLKVALLRLVIAYVDEACYDEARHVLQPLLEDAKDPLYRNARDLLCETYYESAVAALTAEDWASAREGFEAVLKINTAYRDSTALLRVTYTRPYKKALDTKRWDEARKPVEMWLDEYGNDIEFSDSLCEIYYRSAEVSLQAGDTARTVHELQQLARINIHYKKTIQRLEGLFTQLSDKGVWNLAAQIFVTIENIGTVSTSIRQRLESTPALQSAVEAATEVELLWSTSIKTPSDFNRRPDESHITNLLFSNRSHLIAVGYTAYWTGTSQKYHSNGAMVLDRQTKQKLDTLQHQEGIIALREEYIRSLSFGRQDQFLQIYTPRGDLVNLNLATGVIQWTKVNEVRGTFQLSQQIGNKLLEKVRQKANTELVVFAVSTDGYHIAVADNKMKLYMFQRSTSL